MAYRLVLAADIDRTRRPWVHDPTLQPDVSLPSEDVKLAVQEQRLLETQLKIALSHLPDGPSTAAAREALHKAQAHAEQVNQRLIEPSWRAIPPQLKTTQITADCAMKVFDTPELMEHILLNLDVGDILAAQQVCCCFHNTIQGSPLVQKYSGLLADEDAHVYSPLTRNSPDQYQGTAFTAFQDVKFDDHGGLWQAHELGSFSLRSLDSSNAHFSLTWHLNDKGVKLKLGSRSRAILPCQPPVKSLTWRVQGPGISCIEDDVAERSTPPRGVEQPASFVTGTVVAGDSSHVTMGDLYEVVRKTKIKYPQLENRYGSKICSVRFDGVMKLRDTDPIWKRRCAHLAQNRERHWGLLSDEMFRVEES